MTKCLDSTTSSWQCFSHFFSTFYSTLLTIRTTWRFNSFVIWHYVAGLVASDISNDGTVFMFKRKQWWPLNIKVLGSFETSNHTTSCHRNSAVGQSDLRCSAGAVVCSDCLYFLSLLVMYYTASLTFNNCTFCPHSVFMCFVWNWEQAAIISLCSINWLVFITEI